MEKPLTEAIGHLELKMQQYVEKHLALEDKLIEREAVLHQRKLQILTLQKELFETQEKCKTLEQANALLGGDEFRRATKFKINKLIKDIDLCISELM